MIEHVVCSLWKPCHFGRDHPDIGVPEFSWYLAGICGGYSNHLLPYNPWDGWIEFGRPRLWLVFQGCMSCNVARSVAWMMNKAQPMVCMPCTLIVQRTPSVPGIHHESSSCNILKLGMCSVVPLKVVGEKATLSGRSSSTMSRTRVMPLPNIWRVAGFQPLIWILGS